MTSLAGSCCLGRAPWRSFARHCTYARPIARTEQRKNLEEEPKMSRKSALIISAHSADFVWRCGGAIALHAQMGYEVTVLCLSYGERGESAKLWKNEGMTLEKVKSARKAEAENAARAIDVHDIRFMDLGDYPLEVDRAAKDRIVDVIRKVQPSFMMSHSRYDQYNTDHMYATQVALETRMIAQ